LSYWVLRHIIAKSILRVVKCDALEALQLCVGQRRGCEATIHAMRDIFLDGYTEGILLVDVSNAFNSLNRHAALLNMFHLCPPLATTLTNTYRSAAALFIDGNMLWSSEGMRTTQGDPLVMPMYAISLVPLIRQLSGLTQQVWYADDAAASDSILQLREWWSCLSSAGHHLGYFTNAKKICWLLSRNSWSMLRILCRHRHTNYFNWLPLLRCCSWLMQEHAAHCVGQWTESLNRLVSFAQTQPHASSSAFTHGFSSKWTFSFAPFLGSLILLFLWNR